MKIDIRGIALVEDPKWTYFAVKSGHELESSDFGSAQDSALCSRCGSRLLGELGIDCFGLACCRITGDCLHKTADGNYEVHFARWRKPGRISPAAPVLFLPSPGGTCLNACRSPCAGFVVDESNLAEQLDHTAAHLSAAKTAIVAVKAKAARRIPPVGHSGRWKSAGGKATKRPRQSPSFCLPGIKIKTIGTRQEIVRQRRPATSTQLTLLYAAWRISEPLSVKWKLPNAAHNR